MPPLALQIAVAPLHLSILADPQFPFKALGLVHLSQRITQTGAIPTAQAVNLRAFTTEAQWARRGMTFGLVTEALVDGQLLWHSETTALAVGASPARGAAGPKQADGPADPRPESPPWREVSSHELPESLGRRYASIAGDLNPIHQHALLARPFGFRRAIIHGTWTLARALAAARLPHGAAYTVDAQFRKPVLLPSGIAVWSRQGPDHDEVKVTDLDGGKVHLTARIGR